MSKFKSFLNILFGFRKFFITAPSILVIIAFAIFFAVIKEYSQCTTILGYIRDMVVAFVGANLAVHALKDIVKLFKGEKK